MNEVAEIAQTSRVTIEGIGKLTMLSVKGIDRLIKFIKWLYIKCGNKEAAKRMYSRPGQRRVLAVPDEKYKDFLDTLKKLPNMDYVEIPDINKEDGFKHVVVHDGDLQMILDVCGNDLKDNLLKNMYNNEEDFLKAHPEHQKDIDDFIKESNKLPVNDLVKEIEKSSEPLSASVLEERLKVTNPKLTKEEFLSAVNIAKKAGFIKENEKGELAKHENFQSNLDSFKETVSDIKKDRIKEAKVELEKNDNFYKITLNKGEKNSLLVNENIKVEGKNYNDYYLPNSNKQEYVRIPREHVFEHDNKITDEAFIDKEKTYEILNIDQSIPARRVRGSELQNKFKVKEKAKVMNQPIKDAPAKVR